MAVMTERTDPGPIISRSTGLWKARRVLRRWPVFSGGLIIIVVFLAVFAPLVAPYDPDAFNLRDSLDPPSFSHILGTDGTGRDIFSRLLYSARVSLLVGAAAALIAAGMGSFYGILAGYFGGFFGETLMRFADLKLTLPSIMVALVAAATYGTGPVLWGIVPVSIILILGTLYSAHFARMARGETLIIKESDYVALARVHGCSNLRIMFQHILPNIRNTIIVYISLIFAQSVLAESAFSFIGAGVPSSTPTWGSMISQGRDYIATSWWLITFPGVAILLTVMSVNLLGDWLRDRLDPRLRRRI